MKLMSWNCRGAWELTSSGSNLTLSAGKSSKILFLMETKQSLEEMKRIQDDLPYRCMFMVPSIRRSGSLALL